jgi:hypothetical protein
VPEVLQVKKELPVLKAQQEAPSLVLKVLKAIKALQVLQVPKE